MTITETAPTLSKTERWSVDATRTTVEFEAKSLWGLVPVGGRFDRFHGSYTVGPNGPEIELAIDADSIDTGNRRRDEHLRAEDFFSVGEHPWVRFTSQKVTRPQDGVLRVSGELEVAGKSVPLTFDASVRPQNEELEIEAATTVDHEAFGMSRGPLRSIKTPTTLYVKTRLVPEQDKYVSAGVARPLSSHHGDTGSIPRYTPS